MKKVETAIDMLEHLNGKFCELASDERIYLMEQLSELDEFHRGMIYGRHEAFQEIMQYIRTLEKHGYEHLQVADYSSDFD